MSRKQFAVSSLTLFLLLTAHSALLAAIVEVSSQRIGISVAPPVATQDLAFPGTVTTGDFLVVGGALYSGTAPTLSVTSTCSAALTVVTGGTVPDAVFIAYGFATSTGTCTVTVTDSADIAFLSFGMTTLTGVNSTPLDVSAGYTSGSGVSAIQDITTVASGALIIGVLGYENSWTTTPDSAYTEIYEQEDGITYQGTNVVFRIVPTPSTYSVLWSLGASNDWQSYVVSFKPAGAVGGPVVRHRPIMQ